jgi:hypothetical protein
MTIERISKWQINLQMPAVACCFATTGARNHRTPEFKGEATIERKKYWVAAWVKEKDGKKFFSIAFRPKEEQQAKPAAGRSSFDRPIDDNIPF